MAEEQKKIIIDDEYQFPEEEYLSPEAESSAKESAAGAASAAHPAKLGLHDRWIQLVKMIPALRNKRVWIAIIIIFLIIALLPLFKPSPKSVMPTPAAVVTTPAVEAPAPIDINNTLPSTSSRMESKVRDLQAQVTDLQSSVEQLKVNNQQLAQTVTDLAGQLRDLTNQLGEALATGVGAHGPRIVYHLRAVLPDRAWITTNTGETLTVTIGDEIKHYGVVRAIDPNNGVIETSSGRKITYGPNDF